jgi:hypothetical protein
LKKDMNATTKKSVFAISFMENKAKALEQE